MTKFKFGDNIKYKGESGTIDHVEEGFFIVITTPHSEGFKLATLITWDKVPEITLDETPKSISLPSNAPIHIMPTYALFVMPLMIVSLFSFAYAVYTRDTDAAWLRGTCIALSFLVLLTDDSAEDNNKAGENNEN